MSDEHTPGPGLDRLTPITGCGCHLDPIPDDQNCDLCSEGTGLHDGVGWIIRMCPIHTAAPALLAACKATLECIGPHFETHSQLTEAVAKATRDDDGQ